MYMIKSHAYGACQRQCNNTYLLIGHFYAEMLPQERSAHGLQMPVERFEKERNSGMASTCRAFLIGNDLLENFFPWFIE